MRGVLRMPTLVLAGIGASFPVLANCLPTKRFSTWGQGGYFYIHTLPASTNTQILGRFWQPGAFATTNDQSCSDPNWLRIYSPDPTHPWYISGELGGPGCSTVGCPTSEMVVLLEDKSANGQDAFFAVGRVDETSSGWMPFDFSRTGRDWNLVRIPGDGNFLYEGIGDAFDYPLNLRDPADGFYGLPGASAAGTISAFLVYSTTNPAAPRERSSPAWTFRKRIPYGGGITHGSLRVGCTEANSGLRLAVALEFDGGQVVTSYLSSMGSPMSCDPCCTPPGAGAVRESGSESLRVQREPTGELTLAWGNACASGVNQGFEVYEGVLGDWDSHAPRACALPDAVHTFTFSPLASDAYFLVVPYEDVYEGSYGRQGDGTERPLGNAFCRQRSISNVCPP